VAPIVTWLRKGVIKDFDPAIALRPLKRSCQSHGTNTAYTQNNSEITFFNNAQGGTSLPIIKYACLKKHQIVPIYL
jgi:hypothetical protein